MRIDFASRFVALLVVATLALVSAAQAEVHEFPPKDTPGEVQAELDKNCPVKGESSAKHRYDCLFYYDDSDRTVWQEANKWEGLQREPFLYQGAFHPADRNLLN